MTRLRRSLALVVGLAAAGGLLYLCLRRVSLAEVAAEIGAVSIGLLLASIAVRGGVFFVAALRSRILFAPIEPIGMVRLAKSHLLAVAVNNVVPLRAGELARVGYLAKYSGLEASTVIAVIAIERLLDVVSLLVLFLALLPATGLDMSFGSSFYVIAIGAGVATAGAVAASRWPDGFVALSAGAAGLLGARFARFVRDKADAFARGLSGLRSVPAVLAVVGLSLVFWGIVAFSIEIWLWAFEIDLPFYAPVIVLAVLSLGMAVQTTPGHVGTYHFFAIAALTLLGVDEVRATSFAIVTHAVTVIPFTVLAIPVLLSDYLELRRAAQ